MALPQYFLQELKYKNDISEVAASYVNLKRRGKNMIGLCPFHNEKTPSFNIYPENGSFYCFGCNTGGDVITFIMRIENLDYIETIRFLAQRSGLQMPEEGIDDSMSRLRTRILEVNRETARFYHSTLLSEEGKAGLDYLRRRQLEMNTIKRFGLGYSPSGGFRLVNHLKDKGYTQTEMVQANVAGLSRNNNLYDRFKTRVMFPIIDLRGNVVAFGGRILTDEKPKYINTSDTPVYHKSSGLFAMNIAKNNTDRQLILAEGYMDVIALHRAGFTGAVASLGTSLTAEQSRVMARYAEEVVICYDSDEAGQRATARAIPILKSAGLFVKVLTVPGNKDPDEFMRMHGENGPVRFKALLEECGNDIEYKLHRLRGQHNLETAEGRHRYLLAGAEVLSSVDDVLARDIYAGTLSQETEVNKASIMDMANKIAESQKKKKYKQQIKAQNEIPMATSVMNKEKKENTRIANAEEGILSYLFQNQDQIPAIREKLPEEKMITAFNRRLYGLLLGKTIYDGPQGELFLTDFSAELTPDEMSELARILARGSTAPIRKVDAEEYIRVIMGGAGFTSATEIKSASDEDLENYWKLLKKQKTGGNE